MNAGLIAGIVAIVVAALLTPVVRRMAIAIGAVDLPGGRRVHAVTTPRLGGVAIVIAYVAAVVAVIASGGLRGAISDLPALWVFLGAGVLIALTGVVDDVRALGAKRKLFLQTVVAVVAWFGGARIATTVFVPGLGPIFIGTALSFVFTIVWILAFINAINLIDGLDGLAGGVVFFATATNLVVAWVTGNVLAAVLNAALSGAVLGFLFYNFNPATIFMGDSGSMFLGYALGTAALMSGRQKESTIASLLVPVIALGLPITDTLLAMVRRMVGRRSLFSADRQHLHHRLLDLGVTHRRAVLILYGCSMFLCFAALAAALGRNWQVGVAITGAVLMLIGVVRFAGFFEVLLLKRRQRAELLRGPTDRLRRALPPLVVQAESASSAADVWAALERVLDAAQFAYAEYVPSGEQPSWRWAQRPDGDIDGKLAEAEFVVRAFPGASDSLLRFGCNLNEIELPPQIEILLQVVADSVEQALVRIHTRAPSLLMRAVSPASG
ncbi:MAG TPA: MraY family glycosyltransferase [Polyangiaceae bacterium]|jgi:UDP-GlcNAc:undecaprenyl-phosphate GlcNAc-1-phosphate transferase|nr:MraY family glycosyltransferase [Polyangiaceae bacterium]